MWSLSDPGSCQVLDNEDDDEDNDIDEQRWHQIEQQECVGT